MSDTIRMRKPWKRVPWWIVLGRRMFAAIKGYEERRKVRRELAEARRVQGC